MVRFSAWQQARTCHHIMGVTQEIGQAYCNLAGRPVTDATEIPNGVDPSEFTVDLDTRLAARHKRSISPTQFVVGYVGSFSVWHGIPALLEAVEILQQTRPGEILFALVGNGECFAEATRCKEQKQLDNLWLPGPARDRQDLHGWMTCFDVGLCTNLPIQGSPLKYFEYLACGIPVLGSGALSRRQPGVLDHANGYRLLWRQPAALFAERVCRSRLRTAHAGAGNSKNRCMERLR